FIIGLFKGAVTWLVKPGIDIITGLWDGATSVVSWLWRNVKTLIGNLVEFFAPAVKWLYRAGIDFLTGLWNGIFSILAWLGSKILAMIRTQLKSPFADAISWLVDAGKNLITGLWNGAWAIAQTATSWVAKIGGAIIKAVKGFFGIHSPSSVFMGIGENLMTGLFQGMVGGAKGLGKWVLGQIKNIGGSITSDVLNWLGFGSGSSSNQGDVGSSNANASANQAWARGELGLFGWGGGQMTPLIELWNRESGWNQNAQNPSSTAYGIAQFLDTTWAAYGPKTNNPQLQMQYGMEYIAGRYGDPAAAWAHEVNAGWYDKGGYLPPGLSLAVNRTGHREQVVPAGASNATLDDVLGALDQLIAVCAAAPGATSAGLAGALGGAGRSAAYRALYGTR
ncbi:MAG: transglycosylase SLT domain-containing protein, partial [Streptosporangiaceae bacterium]